VLVRDGAAEAAQRAIRGTFAARFGIEPGFQLLRPGPGAGPITEPA